MNVIIFHDNCPDGWGSAWWLGKHLPDHVKHPGRYGEQPPYELCDGADVWLVDFCYLAGELETLIATCKTLTVLDHHATAAREVDALQSSYGNDKVMVFDSVHAMRDMEELCGGAKANICIDQTHSGVGLVGQYVKRWLGVEPPEFLANIEDRDLWRFAFADTRNVFAAVTSEPYTVEAWDRMDDVGVCKLEVEGRAINRYRDQLIAQVAASTFDLRLTADLVVPCASSPYAIGSDVAGILAANHPSKIGAYCILHATDVQIGLRSTPDGPDVEQIAKLFGGGGHPHASGLRITWDQFALAILVEPD